jgi:hypothetical protein
MMSFICSCRNKNQLKAIYPKGTSHHTSLFRGPSTNGMKKVGWSSPLLAHSSHHPLLPPPRRPLTGPPPPKFDPRMKRRNTLPKQYLPLQTRTRHRRSHRPHPMCKVDELAPALINTCHDVRFAQHIDANVDAGQCIGV